MWAAEYARTLYFTLPPVIVDPLAGRAGVVKLAGMSAQWKAMGLDFDAGLAAAFHPPDPHAPPPAQNEPNSPDSNAPPPTPTALPPVEIAREALKVAEPLTARLWSAFPFPFLQTFAQTNNIGASVLVALAALSLLLAFVLQHLGFAWVPCSPALRRAFAQPIDQLFARARMIPIAKATPRAVHRTASRMLLSEHTSMAPVHALVS